jgi:magnesium and cobalt transporter
VIEEIVGEIADEYDTDEDQTIRREGDRQFVVLALTRVQEFNDYFGTRFSVEEFDTIGGLVMQQFGRLPRRGEAVTMDGIEFRVLRADRRRIDQLRVTTPGPLPAAASGDVQGD